MENHPEQKDGKWVRDGAFQGKGEAAQGPTGGGSLVTSMEVPRLREVTSWPEGFDLGDLQNISYVRHTEPQRSVGCWTSPRFYLTQQSYPNISLLNCLNILASQMLFESIISY